VLAGCGSESVMKDNVACTDTDDIQFACAIRNPEDLVYFTPTNEIIFGEYGDMSLGRAGTLAALDPISMDTRNLTILPDGAEQWGDANCEMLPTAKLSPHGLDLSQRGDGSWQLLVVNHYQRESIEFFELRKNADGAVLHPRGCVQMPAENRINDVAATTDTSGFIVTHMLNIPKFLLGLDTGYVLEWAPGSGFKRLPGSDGSFPNGVTMAPDQKSYYLNQYTSSKVSHIDRTTGELLNIWEVSYPDNSSLGSDGRLYVSSALGSVTDALECAPKDGFNCMIPFAIEAIDLQDGSRELVYKHEDGLIPVATVALPLNGALYLGSYSSDRLSRVILK
jgi:DNA-binding beta-propeller fold protein YncE